MREIKFRAYINDGGYRRVSEVGEIKFTNSVSQPYLIFDEVGTLLENETVEQLVEFTGLKDKNGKEIYEGDILEAKTKGFVFRETIEMGWSPTDNNEYGWHWRNGVPIRPVDRIDERFEVIGNIYENKELLTR
jgi:hypothetical protein